MFLLDKLAAYINSVEEFVRRLIADLDARDRPPDDVLVAGNAFRDSLVVRADAHGDGAPLWNGWAIMEAFVAGAKWMEERGK